MSANPKKQPIVFGKYFLLDRINIGGMAEVWRGKTFGAGGFERLVAIKRILPNIAEDDEFKTMFIDEAKISVQLTHANIAQVHDLGQIGSSLFIAMEYIPGKDLRAIFDRSRKKGEPAPIPLTCYVISKLCDALDYAHRKKDGAGKDMNIVHRDVSPQNVLISFDGEVKVIDFGIAKAAGKATKTQAGILKGKFGYMSPEQIRGLPLDRRSDVFAIGVCLYELLTGERLFVGDSDFSVLEKVRRADVLAPSTYNRRVPEALERVVLKALAKDVDVRYQYASELFKDLQQFVVMPEVFTQRDLAQYMKSTFAEDVEREKVRLHEYSELKLQGQEGPELRPTRPNQPAMRLVEGPEVPTPPSEGPESGTFPLIQSPPASPGPPALPRTATHNAMPKLTPANPSAVAERDMATQLVAAPPDPAERKRTDPTWRKGQSPTGATTEPPEAQVPALALEPEPATRSERPILITPRTSSQPTLAAMAVPVPVAITPTLPATPSGMASPRVTSPILPELAAVVPQPASSDDDDAPTEVATSLAQLARVAKLPVKLEPHPVPPPAPQPAPSGGKLRLVGAALAGLILVLSGAVAGYYLRAGASGFIQIDVHPRPTGKVKLSINGRDYGTPDSWPVVQQVSPGMATVKIAAEGYPPLVQTVEVREGKAPAQLKAELRRAQETTLLVVVTDPQTAEIKVNGKTVHPEGSGEYPHIQVPVGTEQQVTASRRGFRAREDSVTPTRSDEPVIVYLRLDPAEYHLRITSQPSGAVIQSGDRVLGQTPAVLKVSPELTQVTLRHKCFAPHELKLRPPAEPNEVVPLTVELDRLPGCR